MNEIIIVGHKDRLTFHNASVLLRRFIRNPNTDWRSTSVTLKDAVVKSITIQEFASHFGANHYAEKQVLFTGITPSEISSLLNTEDLSELKNAFFLTESDNDIDHNFHNDLKIMKKWKFKSILVTRANYWIEANDLNAPELSEFFYACDKMKIIFEKNGKKITDDLTEKEWNDLYINNNERIHNVLGWTRIAELCHIWSAFNLMKIPLFPLNPKEYLKETRDRVILSDDRIKVDLIRIFLSNIHNYQIDDICNAFYNLTNKEKDLVLRDFYMIKRWFDNRHRLII